MYTAFFDELEKIAAEEAKKPNWGRRAAIGGTALGALALGGGLALRSRKLGKLKEVASKATQKATSAAPKVPPKAQREYAQSIWDRIDQYQRGK